MKRIPACLTVLGISLVLGIATCLGYSAWSSFTIIGMQLLDFFDFISNNILMPITALATAIFVGYVLKPKAIIEEAECEGNHLKGKKLFTVMIKYIAPIFIVLILISSILDFFGIVKI
jgi:NSS family neurotransmitter:Na+ symporter